MLPEEPLGDQYVYLKNWQHYEALLMIEKGEIK